MCVGLREGILGVFRGEGGRWWHHVGVLLSMGATYTKLVAMTPSLFRHPDHLRGPCPSDRNMRGRFQKAGTPVRPSLACLHGPGLECGASRCSIRRFVALCHWGICKLPPTNLLFSVFSPCTFPPDIPDYRLTACQVWQSREVCLEKPLLSPDTYSLITIKPAWSTVRWCYSWFHNPAAILTRNPVLQLSTRRTPTRLSLSTFLADCYWGLPS